jgi:hypothetical protein
MTTPNVSNSSIAFSQINGELSYPLSATIDLNEAIVRQLTGNATRQASNSTIYFSDLSNKTAFGGLSWSSTNASSADFGNTTTTINFSTFSSLYSPTITWTANVVSGYGGIVVSNTAANNLSVSIPLNNIGTVTANVQVGVTVSYGGWTLGTATEYVTITSTVYDPALTFTGNTNVNQQGYVAQTATTTLTAVSNSVSNTTITFVVTPTNGVTISGNSVIFSVPANTVTTVNTMIYTVQTNVNYKGQVIATNTQTVSVTAAFNGADFNFVVPATSNNVFQNNGPVTSSLSVQASHNIPNANIAWSYSYLSGSNVAFTVDPTNANSTITLTANDATMAKNISYVTATLQYANGYVLNTKTTQLTLRAGAYDMTIVPGANVSLSGYAAQTAYTTSTISWGAGTFALNYTLANGTSGVVANVISTGSQSSSLTITEYANTMGMVAASTYTINPVITYDGLVVANVTFPQYVSASYLSYTFNVSGNTTNTAIGTGNVVSSVVLTGTHTVPNGTISWTSTNANVALTSNTSVATLSIATQSILTQNTTVTATLLDATGRTVTSQQFPIVLRAYAPNVSFTGPTAVSVAGYAANQVAVASIAATCGVTGANTFTINASKVSGNDLTIINYTGNTTTDQITVEVFANTGVPGTLSGTYQLAAVVGWYGTSYSVTENVTVTATTLNPNFTLTANGQTSTGYSPPVQANGQAIAAYSVPNGNVQWSYTGGTPNSYTSNSTVFSFTNIESNVATSNVNLAVTATLLDGNNLFVAAQTVTVNTTAQFISPTPTLSGNTTVSVSNIFSATANTTLTASLPAVVPSATFQFSTTLVSGTAPTVTTTANTISLALTASGSNATATCKINVTCNVVINGTVVATTTTPVTLTSTAPAPTMNYATYSNSQSSYNYPIYSDAIAAANFGGTPASGQYIVIQYGLVSGPAAWVSNTSGSDYSNQSSSGSYNVGGGGNIYFNQQTSAVGSATSVYAITWQFYSPTGVLLQNVTGGQLTVTATRNNPNFSFNYGGGPSSVTSQGWTSQGTVQAIVSMQAYNNSGIPGVSYQFSAALQSGSAANFNYNNASGACNVQLISDGSAESCNYNVSCSLYSNGQLIGGPIVIPAACSVQPYYISILGVVGANGYVSSTSAGAGGWSVEFQSNYPNFQNYFSYTNVNIGTPGGCQYRPPQTGQTFNSPTMYVYTEYSPTPPAAGVWGCIQSVTGYVNGVQGPSVTVPYQCTVITPTGTCVGEDMWMDDSFQAHQVIEGMVFNTWTPEEEFSVDFVKEASGPHQVEVVRITTHSGAQVDVSHNTPFVHKDSPTDMQEFTYAADLLGVEVLVDIYGKKFWEPVVKVEYLGIQNVYALNFGGKSYAAGVDPNMKIYSHNKTPTETDQ